MAYKFQVGPAQLSGALTQEGAGTFEGAVVGESTISGSSTLSGFDLVIQDGQNIGVNGQTDLMTLAANSVDVAGDVSASLGLEGFDLLIQAGANIGINGQTDLMTLASNKVSVAGEMSASTDISGHALDIETTADIEGILTVGASNAFTVNASGEITACPSGSITDLFVGDDAHIVGDLTVEGSTNIAGLVATTMSGTAVTFTTIGGTSLALQGGGITAAGAIAGVSTISGSDTLTISHVDIDGTIDAAAGAFTVNAAGNLTACPSASIADLYVSDDAQFADTVLVEGAFSASAGLHITNGMGLIVGASGETQINNIGELSTTSGISGSNVEFSGSDAILHADWLPDADNVFDIGSSTKRWANIYVDNIVGASINVDVETGNGIWVAGSEIMLANGNLTLPAGGSPNGKIVRVKNISAGMVRIDASSGENFFNDADGSTTGSVELETRGAAISMVYSGSNWYIF